jgi:hypothetical protein
MVLLSDLPAVLATLGYTRTTPHLCHTLTGRRMTLRKLLRSSISADDRWRVERSDRPLLVRYGGEGLLKQ